MNKRIMFISTGHIKYGAEHSLEFIIRELRGYVLLICPKSSENHFSNLQVDIIPRNLKSFRYSLNPLLVISYLINIIVNWIAISKISKRNQIDIIIYNSIKASIYGHFLTRSRHVKHLVYLRDSFCPSFLTKHLINRMDALISVSAWIQNQIGPYVSKPKIVLYPSLDLGYWGNNALEKINALPTKKIVIAQIGQLIPLKNHSLFIDAAKKIKIACPSVSFMIIGGDPLKSDREYVRKLKKKIAESKLIDCFSILGYTKDLKLMMKNIDIVVHPNPEEPFGRVLIEAMAMEKPVIAVNRGGPSEIVSNNETGFLIPENDIVDGIANRCITLIQNPDLRKRMGQAGRSRTIKYFDSLNNTRRLEAFINEI